VSDLAPRPAPRTTGRAPTRRPSIEAESLGIGVTPGTPGGSVGLADTEDLPADFADVVAASAAVTAFGAV
jgi:hypothetical protein